MSNKKRVMLYGATGFTARLMIDGLRALPCELVLAGRTKSSIEELARKYDSRFQVFSLSDTSEIERNLREIDLVINCAGPFTKTAEQMANAALAAKTSYFDITGELSIFMRLFEKSEFAKAQSVTLIPGLGFDIAPSDCLASLLAKRVSAPRSLTLAIATKNTRVSHGTLKTIMLESKSHRISRRQEGIKSYEGLSGYQNIVMNNKTFSCLRAPLGDLFCAHLSTGIENIDTFVAIPKSLMTVAKILPLVSKLSKVGIIERLIAKAIESLPNGPSEEQQQKGFAYIYGEVTDKDGSSHSAVMKTKEPYVYTADLMVAGTKSWLERGLPSGFLTPSQAFGADFAQATCPGQVQITYSSSSSHLSAAPT